MPKLYEAWLQAEGPRQQPATSHRPFVSSRYVVWLASQADDTLMPVITLSPKEPERLARSLESGVTRVIWNPAAQPLDTASETAATMFKQLAEHDAVLQVRIGRQDAADGSRHWIAPASVRPALAAGVHVELILGAPAGADGQQLMPAVFRLLENSEHDDDLRVSLAGVLASDRIDSVLWPLLQHPQFHDRLVYASDYPDSVRPGAVALSRLVDKGFIDPALEAPLREIYQVNPLLFVLATTVRALHLPGTTLGLPASVFFATD